MSLLAITAVEALGKILIKAGTPILKRVLEQEVGGTAGQIGSVVIDSIGTALGVEPTAEAIVAQHEAEPSLVEQTVRDVEVGRDWVKYLAEATASRDKLLEREDARDSFFSWGWRPAMSWLVIFLFGWAMVLVPLANSIFGAALIAPATTDILQFAGIWLVIYGGGHTAKEIFGAKK